MKGQRMDILRAIGNTSIVRLRRVVPPGCADILVKLEWENPTGSMKDRMAQAAIERAEKDGRLKPVVDCMDTTCRAACRKLSPGDANLPATSRYTVVSRTRSMTSARYARNSGSRR